MKKKKKNVVYVLWFQSNEKDGWVTLNTTETGDSFNQAYDSREDAVIAWKRHNRLFPEDEKMMSVRKFVEA